MLINPIKGERIAIAKKESIMSITPLIKILCSFGVIEKF